MSEQSGGAGWWLASDGKWYPPSPERSTPEMVPEQAQPWWRRSVPLWSLILAGVVGVALGAGSANTSDERQDVAASDAERTTATDVDDATTTTVRRTTTTTRAPTTTNTPTTTTAPTTTADPHAGETVSQENAREKAADYLEYSSFSRSGLIKQLEFEGFSQADATYGVDALNADWFEQAAKKAAEYMEYSSFSRSGLIEQLKFEGFTQTQAEHGADSAGL